MSHFPVNRRLIAAALTSALVVTTVVPAAAQRIPVAKDFVEPVAEDVAMRRKRRGNGNQALGAAILFGAAALGVAAVAASQNRKRERAYYAPHYGYAPNYGYAPVYHHQPQVYYRQPAPQVYYHQPAPQVYYRQPRHHGYAPAQQRWIGHGRPHYGYQPAPAPTVPMHGRPEGVFGG